MMLRLSILSAFTFSFLALSACGGDGGGGGGGGGAQDAADDATQQDDADVGPAEGCDGLCVAAGFTGGTEMDFDTVVECPCSGTGDGITQEACDAYCDALGTSDAYLSTENSTNDKCVCDNVP